MNKHAIAIILFFAASLGIVGGVFLTFHYINSPSTGKVENSSLESMIDQASQPVYQTLSGLNFSLQYQNGYNIHITTKGNPSSTESYLLVRNDPLRSSNIGIELVAKTIKLTDNSAYMFRANNKTTYQASQKNINDQTVPVMTKTTGGYEETAFVLHNSWLLIFSLTSNTGSVTGSDQELTHSLSTLMWKSGN